MCILHSESSAHASALNPANRAEAMDRPGRVNICAIAFFGPCRQSVSRRRTMRRQALIIGERRVVFFAIGIGFGVAYGYE